MFTRAIYLRAPVPAPIANALALVWHVAKDRFMDATDPPRPSFQDLMAQIGYLLLHWGFLEQELENAILSLRAADKKSGHDQIERMGPSARLKHWKQLHRRMRKSDAEHLLAVDELSRILADALAMRNSICHGLTGASAPPSGGEAHLRTKSPGKETVYSFLELSGMIKQIEGSRHSISRLTIAALLKPSERPD